MYLCDSEERERERERRGKFHVELIVGSTHWCKGIFQFL